MNTSKLIWVISILVLVYLLSKYIQRSYDPTPTSLSFHQFVVSSTPQIDAFLNKNKLQLVGNIEGEYNAYGYSTIKLQCKNSVNDTSLIEIDCAFDQYEQNWFFARVRK